MVCVKTYVFGFTYKGASLLNKMDWIPDNSLGEEHCRDDDLRWAAAMMQTRSCIHRAFTALGDFLLFTELGETVTLWLSSP